MSTSKTTQSLIELLQTRDQAGQAKYGAALDRTDLSCDQWAAHAIEEALDLAGYLRRFRETAVELTTENDRLHDEVLRLRGENARLRAALSPLLELARTLDMGGAVGGAAEVPPTAPVETSTAGGWSQGSTTNPKINTEKVAELNSTKVAEPAPKAKSLLTRKELSVLLGCDPTSVHNYEKKGLITKLEGTGTSSANPAMYRTEDVPALRDGIAKMLKARDEAMRESLRANRINPKLAQTPQEIPAEVPTETATPKEPTPEGPSSQAPEGGVSFDRAAAYLGISTDSVRIYCGKGKLERAGEGDFVTRASLVARKESLGNPPKATLEINEALRLAHIDEGKVQFASQGIFYLARHVGPSEINWAVFETTAPTPGWEVVEEWRRNGLGRWESTPEIPGAVGAGNGITRGAGVGVILG